MEFQRSTSTSGTLRHLTLATLASTGLAFAAASQLFAQTFPDEPIAYIGHGAAFDRKGREIALTPAFIESAQGYYIQKLRERVTPEQRKEFDRLRETLPKGKRWDRQTQLYASSALMDWLLSRTPIDPMGAIAGKNNLLKYAIRKRAFANKKFVAPEELTKLGAREEPAQRFSTMNSGAAYFAECANAGVPTPPDWGSSQWTDNGELTTEFISGGLRARVFYRHSTSPEGVCYALPRDDGSDIVLLGVICMGKQSSNVCFWDNQENDTQFDIPLGDSVPLADFSGGAELLGGQGGICTTCHSGENPYVIHPGSALDLSGIGVPTMPDNWYDPLVHPNWPQNAGPLTIFDGVPPGPGEQQCTACHVQGNAGRFPKISSVINGWCTNVLERALTLTMPPGAPGDAAFANQFNQLRGLCNAPTEPVMRIEEIVLDYGEVELGFSFRKALVVHNDGDANLTVNIVAPTGDTGQWSEIAPAASRTIAPGSPPEVFLYTYSPQAVAAHTMQMQLTSNDGNQTINFTGSGRNPLPIDTVLVLDRSGSMADAVGDRRKIHAARDAASLYSDLLRDNIGGTGTGDKIGIVKYNDTNSVYLSFDFTTAARKTDIATNFLSDGALTDGNKLNPQGFTGIGGAMQTAAFQLGAPVAQRRQVMVVLTDGKENREPWIGDVIGPIRSTLPGIMMYSVGLGDDIEPTKLQQITNVTNGYHQVQATLTATTLFDLETFYFKIFAHATDMDLVLDPTYAVNLTNPGPIVIAKAGIISSDQSATFLVLDDPVLRQFYDLEFVSPQNNVIVPGVTIGGIPVQEARRHTYRLYRIIFPDISLAHTYVGDWIVRLKPNGKWRRDIIKNVLAESTIQYQNWLSPFQGLVPVGFAAAVSSDYRLQVALSSTSQLPGADVLLTASLTDRGWPAPKGNIDVTVTSQGGPTHNVTLYDDGTHGDQVAADATWSNHFIQTATPNVYKFLYRSAGYNDRGELGQREASRYLTLMQPEPTPPSRPCIPCRILWALLILGLLMLLALLYCCWRGRQVIARQPVSTVPR